MLFKSYEREFLGVQARLDRVLRLLGLNDAPDAAEPPKPSVEELLARARRPPQEAAS